MDFDERTVILRGVGRSGETVMTYHPEQDNITIMTPDRGVVMLDWLELRFAMERLAAIRKQSNPGAPEMSAADAELEKLRREVERIQAEHS